MNQLVVGDDVLDLSLQYVDDAKRGNEEPVFTAEFFSWENNGVIDTIVLSTVEEEKEEYTWVFSGTVYKKLAASGIEYMVLRNGENVMGVPTSGFSGGTRYNMYRSDGKVSKDFVYSITMDANSGFEMDVTVDGTTYALTDDTNAEFYYFNVFSGSAENLEMNEEEQG